MSDIPGYVQDAKSVLTKDGFTTNDTWYHGTSSALLSSIKGQGLKRSGDRALKQAAKSTMATIGNNYTESIEPVFLTQSKELAYYWAQETVRERGARFEGEETPIVLQVNLPTHMLAKVKPDVGAASLLLTKSGEAFMSFLSSVYDRCGFGTPDIDLKNADRSEYMDTLGMAYIDKDIATACVELINE